MKTVTFICKNVRNLAAIPLSAAILVACGGPPFQSDPEALFGEGAASQVTDAGDAATDGTAGQSVHDDGGGAADSSRPPEPAPAGQDDAGDTADAGDDVIEPIEPEHDAGLDAHDSGAQRPDASPKDREICGDDIDNDGNGKTDEPGALGCIHLFWDHDGDGVGGHAAGCYCAGHQPQGVVLAGGDCDDQNSKAHPGQKGWFAKPRANGSFDYDCDGKETLGVNVKGSCKEDGWSSCSIGKKGWRNKIPQCGKVGSWLDSCVYDDDFMECDNWGVKKTQPCR